MTAYPRLWRWCLWGSDNIKSNGGPIAQALTSDGCAPRFDSHRRLCGARSCAAGATGSRAVDVVMTLSGIFRDLLPLQTKMLADAALQCALADEPLDMNPIRAHALGFAAEKWAAICKTAALRVFSNAEGAYGSNVNSLGR